VDGGGLPAHGLIVVILGIVVLAKSLAGSRSARMPGRVLEILKERYAKGELTREPYEQMKRQLAE
jgi:putative membrane protein